MVVAIAGESKGMVRGKNKRNNKIVLLPAYLVRNKLEKTRWMIFLDIEYMAV